MSGLRQLENSHEDRGRFTWDRLAIAWSVHSRRPHILQQFVSGVITASALHACEACSTRLISNGVGLSGGSKAELRSQRVIPSRCCVWPRHLVVAIKLGRTWCVGLGKLRCSRRFGQRRQNNNARWRCPWAYAGPTTGQVTAQSDCAGRGVDSTTKEEGDRA